MNNKQKRERMPLARKYQIDLDKTAIYHCTSRCVRRSFLCGEDYYTGKNYDHRRQWMVDRLKSLTTVFCIEVVGFSVMSNHVHVILRVDREAAEDLPAQGVIDRWSKLSEKPDIQDEKGKQKQKNKLEQVWDAEQIRERLYSISWFMKCLKEPISRMANAEDRCKGTFWEGRFKSQALLDHGALMACLVYVDLNPIRAGMALTPETSEYTSIQERIHGFWDEQGKQKEQVEDFKARQEFALEAGMTPFADTAPDSAIEREAYIPITRLEYFELVDWTGREMRADKKGAIPKHIQPILQRLDLNEEKWLESVTGYRNRFFTMVGRYQTLCEVAEGINRVRFNGKAGVEALYRQVGPPG